MRLGAQYFEPDLTITGEHGPYMLRWYITPWSGLGRGNEKLWARAIRLLPNIYLHHFVHDDPDRALHDHPWASCSVILTGGYKEHLSDGNIIYRKAPAIHFRRASASHRVELYRDPIIYLEGEYNKVRNIREAWTLFFTGPKIRNWGFHCPKGWIPWWEFTKPGAPGEIGKGCE